MTVDAVTAAAGAVDAVTVTDTVAGRPGGEASLDEATLVARARDRDPVAFEALVRRYQGRIYRLCLRMLSGATAEAEDITQDVLVTAWRRLPEIGSDAAFGAWLYRTATNRCLNLIRRRRPPDPLEADPPSDAGRVGAGQAAAGWDPQRVTESAAAMDALAVALARLPPQQRACWLLREVHGRSYEEIAQLLDTTSGSVRGRIARARVELATMMRPWR